MKKNNKIKNKFNPCDCIVNRSAGDIAIVKSINNKGYYQFKEYYNDMFHELKDLKKYNYELQINYQKFFELCNDDEKKKIDDMIKKRDAE